LTLDQNTKELVLTKKKIKRGKISEVEPQEVRGTRVEITPRGLKLYNRDKLVIKTSSLKSL